MNLRRTFLLAITLIPLILSVGVVVYRQYILLPSYIETENQLIEREIGIINGYVDHTVKTLDVINWDWANWDDTYDYMQTGNNDYISSNMVTGTFTDSGINIILLQNNATDTVYGRHVDTETGNDLPIPEEILSFPLFNASGLLVAGDDVFIISSKHILTSNDTGPAMGRMIMAQTIDEEYIGEIAELTQLKTQYVYSTLSETKIIRVNNSKLSTEFPVYDYQGDVAFRIRFDFDRTLYYNGFQNSLILLVYIAVFSAIVGVVSIYIADTRILKRISDLSNELDDISKNHTLSDRLPPQKEDEIGSLVDNINNMLESLEDSANLELRHKEELLRIRERYAVNLIEGTKNIAESLNSKIEKPLQALKNANYLLEKAYPDEKDLQMLYHTSTKNIEKAVNEINYSLPQEEIVFRPFDINETIEKVLGRRPKTEHRYVKLYEDKFHVINGDQNLIHTGVMLLLSLIEEKCSQDTSISIDIRENEGIDLVIQTSKKCIVGNPFDGDDESEPCFEYVYLNEVISSHNGSINYESIDGNKFIIHLPNN
ncbi:MAG: HAMP domain-containing protein [Candidatus Bathyarchaeota archaeon]|nr:HAMP domain-containing protein [Candidatus Bathyarchaeota archaeon]